MIQQVYLLLQYSIFVTGEKLWIFLLFARRSFVDLGTGDALKLYHSIKLPCILLICSVMCYLSVVLHLISVFEVVGLVR